MKIYWFENTLNQFELFFYILSFADGLVPIWCQNISNNMMTWTNQQTQYTLNLIIQN